MQKNLAIVLAEMTSEELLIARPKCVASRDVKCVAAIDKELAIRSADGVIDGAGNG